MKINYQTSRLANFFFFLANLSEWHWSCRRDYNRIWLTQTSSLTEQEKTAIGEFKNLMEKYGFSRNTRQYRLGRLFLLSPEKEIWPLLKRKLPAIESDKIKNIFHLFEPRFSQIWQKETNDFRQRFGKFRKFLEKQSFQSLMTDILYFLNGPKTLRQITVVLIAAPIKGEGITAAGGANLTGDSVTLELPTLKKDSWEIEFSVGVLAHEIGHLIFQQSPLKKVLTRAARQINFQKTGFQSRYSSLNFLEELLIESLAPISYLTDNYFKKNKLFSFSFSPKNLAMAAKNYFEFKKCGTANIYRLRRWLFWQIYPLTVLYINNRQRYDATFLQEMTQKTKDLLCINRR